MDEKVSGFLSSVLVWLSGPHLEDRGASLGFSDHKSFPRKSSLKFVFKNQYMLHMHVTKKKKFKSLEG